jgi:hypothetical protein
MLKLLVILLSLFLLMIFAVKVLVSISDRFVQLPIWKTQTWQTLRVTIIVITVIIGIAILAIIAVRSGKKQERADKEFAQSQGWIYSEFNDPQGRTNELAGKLVKVCPEKEITLDNSITVESGRRSIYLFRCRHRVRDWGPKTHQGFACLIESDRFVPVRTQVDICTRNSIDGLLLSNQVNMADSEFAQSFIVTSKSPVSAKQTVNEALQAVLLDSNRGPLTFNEVSIGPGGAVILATAMTPVVEWLALVDLARRIESGFE